MKKRVIALLMMMAVVLSACQGKADDTSAGKTQGSYEKVQKMLTQMKSYQSEATVAYKSNKGTNVYDTIQQCTADGKYRIEVVGPKNVEGNVTLSDGKLISQFNTKISARISVGVKENQERSEVFLTSFVKNYMSSSEVSVSVGNFGEGKATVLEAVVPGSHPYLATEKLWVDNKTMKPLKLVVYDPDNSERIVVNFKTFDYNIQLEDKLFAVPEME